MTLRRDHIAGIGLIGLAVAVLALGQELPFGTSASPGPGMLPVLCAGLMLALAIVVLLRAGESPPFSEIAWDDIPHALLVIVAASGAAALYTTLGFPITFGLLLFGLTYGVERMPLATTAAVTAVMTGGAYWLLGTLLKTPMPLGIFGF
ncbi:unnamed protein product [Phaeothamnion confervicola]